MNQSAHPLAVAEYRYCGRYPSLDEFIGGEGGGRRNRIAILTADIFGPVRNAGIGTAYMHAATFLADRNFDTTVIFTQGRNSQIKTIDYWIDFYAERGVKFVCARQEPDLTTPTPMLRWSYDGFRQLQSMPPFDIVHASECGASAYYSLLAKRNRGLFRDTLFCIKTSSPHLWSREGNDSPIGLDDGPLIAMIERYCVEQADLVVSPSQHMLDWMQDHNYALPANVCVHPNIFALPDRAPAADSAEPADLPGLAAKVEPAAVQDPTLRKVEEIVFFGRLEPRKGIRLFAEAIEAALPRMTRRPRITFLGKLASEEIDFNFETFLGEIRERTGLEIDAITTHDAAEANGYLGAPGRLAVIPSLLDNSPFTVYEALVNRYPFLASTVGGIPELVHPDDRSSILFAPRAAVLANLLVKVIERGAPLARLSFQPNDSLKAWEAFHDRPAKERIAPALADAAVAGLPARLLIDERRTFPINLDTLQSQAKAVAEAYVFLHRRSFELDDQTLASMTSDMDLRDADIAIPTIRNIRTGEAGVIVNFQPTMWTKLDFSRGPTAGIVVRTSTLRQALEQIAQQAEIATTNLDEIIAVSARNEARIHLHPDVVGTIDGTLHWVFNKTQRNRQIRMLTARLPADLGNIYRVYGALQDERARIMSAQPVLGSLSRLIRILDRVKGWRAG